MTPLALPLKFRFESGIRLMALGARGWVMAVLFVLLSVTVARSEDDSPRLIIDPRGPSGRVKELLFTPSGDTLISLGDDKAIRFWDVDSGALRRTLRLQIGDGPEGQLYAGALSPDGRWLAVGGYDSESTTRLIDLDTGVIAAVLRGHSNSISALAFSDDGRWLASGSTDDSVRVWEIGAKVTVKQGKAVTLEASQVLEGHSANVNAVSLASGGERLVSAADDNKLILWERKNGGTFRRTPTLEKHTDEVYSVAFSPDGKSIVSGGKDRSLLLWDAETGAFQRALEEDSGNFVGSLAFSPDGKFVLQTGTNGYATVYNAGSGERIVRFAQQTNTAPASAWHPTENMVATAGGNDHDVYLWRPQSGEVVHHLRGDGKSGWAVAFAEGGSTKFAFGQTAEGKGRLWPPLQRTFDFSTFTLESLPDGQAEPTGFRRAVLQREGKKLHYKDAYHLETSSGIIENNQGWQGSIRSYSFVPTGEVLVGSSFTLQLHQPSGERVRKFIGHEGEVRAVSPSPDGRYFASASDDQTVRLWSLEEPKPKPFYLIGVTMEDADERIVVKSVAADSAAEDAGLKANDILVSIDGRRFELMTTAISYLRAKPFSDKIVFLVSRNGKELEIELTKKEVFLPPTEALPLASLFVARNGEWVCWLPSGHYHASAGGEKYIGWHINQGPDKVAEYFPSYVFRDQFHNPELVKRTVLLGDYERALAEVGAKPAANLADVLPPKIDWIAPQRTRGDSTAADAQITAKARISSSNAELTEVKLLLNGKSVAADFRASGNTLDFERTIDLVPGENRLALYAANQHSGHTSDERIVFYQPSNTPATTKLETGNLTLETLPKELMPNLYLLSVGISEYENAKLALDYCDDDAEAIAKMFTGQEGKLYGKVETRVLTDADATRGAILDGLTWLETNATQKDIVILFLAAHGANDARGNYYLLPTGGDFEKLRATGVAWDDFADVLGNLPSKTLMFLDTCHSGQLGANLMTFASRGDPDAVDDATEAIRELTSDENGVVIMAASTGREDSVEYKEWGHGAFTMALLEGIEKGEADYSKDGVIHLRELDNFVAEKVKSLTEGIQHPTTVKPSTISRFPVARLK